MIHKVAMDAGLIRKRDFAPRIRWTISELKNFQFINAANSVGMIKYPKFPPYFKERGKVF